MRFSLTIFFHLKPCSRDLSFLVIFRCSFIFILHGNRFFLSSFFLFFASSFSFLLLLLLRTFPFPFLFHPFSAFFLVLACTFPLFIRVFVCSIFLLFPLFYFSSEGSHFVHLMYIHHVATAGVPGGSVNVVRQSIK